MRNYATLDDWNAREGVTFSPGTVEAAVDRMIDSLGPGVELLGLGEPMHGAEAFLQLRNRIFQRLVERHGFTAIAVESSFPRGRRIDEFVHGRGDSGDYAAVASSGFSHNFGAAEGNRELIEWMRAHNAAHGRAIQFYGFDSPTEMMYADSPRALLMFVLDYLASVDATASAQHRRARIEPLLGEDAAWENQAVAMDPGKGIGLSENAAKLRIEAEDLITELAVRAPELIAASDSMRHGEAMRYAELARQMLTYHAAMAGNAPNRIAELLGLRDRMMAENLAYIVRRERSRCAGARVLAFAHNSHLKRGQMQWQLGPNAVTWWPAGAQLEHMLGATYAVIGTGVGADEKQGLRPAEAGTIEALLSDPSGGGARFVATHRGKGLAADAMASQQTRSASPSNPTYFPLTQRSLDEFDGLIVLNS